MKNNKIILLLLISALFIKCNTDKNLGGYIEPYGNAEQPADTVFYEKEKEVLMNSVFEQGTCDSIISKDFTLDITHEKEKLDNYEIAVFVSGMRIYKGKYQNSINIKDVKLCGADNKMASMTFYVFDDQESRIHKFSDGEWTYPILDSKYEKLEIKLLPEPKTFHDSFRTSFLITNISDKIEYEEKRNLNKR